MNTRAAVFTQNGFSMNYKLFYPEKTEGQGHNDAIDYAYRHGDVIDRLLPTPTPDVHSIKD